MTAAVAAAPAHELPPLRTSSRVHRRGALRLVVRPAPHREPPFDDELSGAPVIGPHDQRLPFDLPRPAASAPGVSLRPHGLPDPSAWAKRLLVGLIETADGRRPLHQVAAMLRPSIARGLGTDFDNSAILGERHWLHRAGVLSVRAAEPSDGVAELCATVEVGARVRAVALRLEARHGRWQCTRLQLG